MKIKTLFILTFITLLSSCGKSDGPIVNHIVIKGDRVGVILDTENRNTLDAFQSDFYDREDFPEGDPIFKYLIDVTTTGESVRWQYNPDGKIRIFAKGSKMYKLNNPASFNRTLTIE